MRIIKWGVLRDFIRRHPVADPGLCHWFDVAKKATWQNPADVKATLGSTDMVSVSSGNTVAVFNIAGGKYRLIASIHYNTQRVYTLMVLTHAAYETGRWRKEL